MDNKDTTNFEKSKWVERMIQILKDPQRLAEFEKAVAKFLETKGKTSPTMRRAEQAYRIFRDGKARELLTPRNAIILGAALLYLITPLDAIPDLVPVVGLLDDLGLLSLILAVVLPDFLQENPDISKEEQEELNREIQTIESELNNQGHVENESINSEAEQQQVEEENPADRDFFAMLRRLAARFLPGDKK